MALLAPLFLAGLAGLAVPVYFHLIQREKKRVVQFPSLMFLSRIPYQSVRRRRIHHWTLLLLRMAALLLLVLAFARPYLVRPARTAAGEGAREVVILLDRSYSMGYGDRWTRAKAEATTLARSLSVSDRGSLVLFDGNAEVAVRSTEDKARLLAAIAAAQLSAGGTRYAPGLKVAGTILAESSQPRLEATVISDFQRYGWPGSDAVDLPPTAALRTVSVASPVRAANAAVSGVSLERTTFENQERVTATATVDNVGEVPLTRTPVALELGGRTVQTVLVDVAPGARATVTFQPVTLTAANVRGTVRLPPDALERDNVRHFMVSPLTPLPVLVLDRTPGSPASSLYLTRAAAIGEQPSFDLTIRAAEAVADHELHGAAVVVVNDVAVSAGLAGRLRSYVEGGGGLFVVAGPGLAWPGGDLLPATVGGAVDRSRGGESARLGAVEYGHPLFEAFRAARSGDFSAAQLFGFRVLTPAASSTVLARFDAGAPALVEGTRGRGRVLVWGSTLDLRWTDLPIKPVFLPFVHGALRHLAAYQEAPASLTVGQVLDPGQLAASLTEPVVLTPGGGRVALGGTGAPALTAAEQGFYEVRGARAPGAARAVAVNVDVAESSLEELDPRTLVAAVAPEAGTRVSQAGVPLPPDAQERRQRLWWWLLAAALAAIGAETVLANRLSRA